MPRTFGRWWTVLGCIGITILALTQSPGKTAYAQSTPTPTPPLQNLTAKLVQPNIDFRLEQPTVLYQGFHFLKHALWRPGKNQIAVSYAGDTAIDLIDGITGQFLIHLETTSNVIPSDGIYDLAWSQDGMVIVASFDNEVINVWDLSGKTVRPPLTISYDTVRSKEDPSGDLGRAPNITLSSDHRWLAAVWGSDYRNVFVWSLPSGQLLKTMRDWPNRGDEANPPVWIKWSPNGNYFVVGTRCDDLRAFSSSTYRILAEAKGPGCVESDALPYAAWRPDSKVISILRCVRSASRCTPYLWNIETNTTQGDSSTSITAVMLRSPLAWRNDGKYLASVADYSPRALIWDSSTLKIAAQISGFEYPVIAASWNQDDSRFLTAYKDQLVLWKVIPNP
jgi:WD40 repeat protein